MHVRPRIPAGTRIGCRGTGAPDLERRAGPAKRLCAARPVPGTKRRGVPSGVGVLRSSPQRDGEPTPRTGVAPPLWTTCPPSPMWRGSCPRERAKHRAGCRPHRGVSPARGGGGDRRERGSRSPGSSRRAGEMCGSAGKKTVAFRPLAGPDPDPTRPDLTTAHAPHARHPDRHSRDPSRARSLQ